MRNTRALGMDGEAAGVAYLAAHGYRVRERNYRSVYGEVDAIAEQGGDLVFVEIKYRRSSAYGMPFEAVTATKQKTLARCAQQYLKEHCLHGRTVRFDVLSIGPAVGKFDLITSAFVLAPSYTR